MQLYAIGDLHLPGGDVKPMDVFGDHWQDHFARIAADWKQRVTDDDVVLVPGDVSWAMKLADALPDLAAIGELPGRKVLLKGNHDLWWGGIGLLRRSLPEGMYALQNDALDLGDCVVCGSRGWAYPTEGSPLTDEDRRIFDREMIRLEMSLKEAVRLAQGRPIVVMMHYPPLYRSDRDTPFTRLLRQYPVDAVVYGHLHGDAIKAGFTGEHEGIRYQLTSCDALGFVLAEVPLDKTNISEK